MDASSLPPRTLVLCFDGTANQYDGTVSQSSHDAFVDFPERNLFYFLEHERREILLTSEKRHYGRAAMLLPGTAVTLLGRLSAHRVIAWGRHLHRTRRRIASVPMVRQDCR